MKILLYAIIFIIGTLFGSFFTLAIYRIPLKQDITHKRSFCPNCGHKLKFLDLIPILSYVFLGGKCRYCKQKIRPRYIFLELLSGLAFLIFAIQLKINILNIETYKVIYLVYGFLYLATLFIIAGIEKEHHQISKPVLIFGLIINAMYIIYLYIINVSIYKYVIYLILMLVLLITESIILRKKQKNNYSIEILTLCTYLVMATKEEIVILSIILTLWLIAIKQMILNKKDNKQEIIIKNQEEKIPIGYYLCITNIIIFATQNLIF